MSSTMLSSVVLLLMLLCSFHACNARSFGVHVHKVSKRNVQTTPYYVSWGQSHNKKGADIGGNWSNSDYGPAITHDKAAPPSG
ncbi:hypothetical protein OROMI_013875 [Orobanche minor]